MLSRLAAALLGTWSSVALPAAINASEVDVRGIEFYEEKIRPIFAEHCYECHSRQAQLRNNLKGGLFLDSGGGIRDGGDSGPLLEASDPGHTILLRALRHEDLEMPPSERLSDEFIANVETWIKLGAPAPAQASDGKSYPENDGEAAREHWAFRPPILHQPPAVTEAGWPRHELDHFVLAEMENRGMRPVKPAGKRELIRRATLDLIGLPPTEEECDEFDSDDASDAFAKVVDRLLQSPHYGERWARLWLDIARYADDQGNAFVSPAPTAYLYRDWVVQAFNEDMPYDKFICLQLAGDELTSPCNDYFERLAGLGFQGLGPRFRKGAAGDAKAKADEIEDRIDTLSRGLLGLTVACARCHDHKFDPIPTRDYYSMAAAYNGATWEDRMLASPETVSRYKQWRDEVQQLKADLKAWVESQRRQVRQDAIRKIDAYVLAACKIRALRRAKRPVDEAAWAEQEHLKLYFLTRCVGSLEAATAESPLAALRTLVDGSATDSKNPHSVLSEQPELLRGAASLKAEVDLAFNALETAAEPPDNADRKTPTQAQRTLGNMLWITEQAPFFVKSEETIALLGAGDREEAARRQARLDELAGRPPEKGAMTPSVSGGGEPMHIYIRGNPAHLGPLAPPGFLSVLNRSAETEPSAKFTRLELANAIVNPKNPLTARVFVNRIWNAHFGRGIVATPGNFGKLGGQPTHPNLLDTLSVRFVESGWSVKWLQREIMLSATYQLSCDSDPGNKVNDPDNHYLWRMAPRRLEAEVYRDALLSVAGRLDEQVGGPSLDQDTPAMSDAPGPGLFTRLKGLDADNPTNGRRTLYCIVSRYAPNSTLGLFDFPEPNMTSDLRNVTTVPQQQLFVLNSPFMIEMARAFARRVEQAVDEDPQRLATAWRLAYCRSPTAEEMNVGLDFLRAAPREGASDKMGRLEQLCHAILASNEFTYRP
jgi:mono/diheme cytochrome c family protein